MCNFICVKSNLIADFVYVRSVGYNLKEYIVSIFNCWHTNNSLQTILTILWPTSISHFILAALPQMVHCLIRNKKKKHDIYIVITLTKTASFSKLQYYVSFRSTIAFTSQVRVCIMLVLLIVEIKKKMTRRFFPIALYSFSFLYTLVSWFKFECMGKHSEVWSNIPRIPLSGRNAG